MKKQNQRFLVQFIPSYKKTTNNCKVNFLRRLKKKQVQKYKDYTYLELTNQNHCQLDNNKIAVKKFCLLLVPKPIRLLHQDCYLVWELYPVLAIVKEITKIKQLKILEKSNLLTQRQTTLFLSVCLFQIERSKANIEE